ncbi:MAG TPA: ATP-binding protein [Kofleriaceae bacterium]|nr:ATP-binding protein [Kofleriaceae bacterium]
MSRDTGPQNQTFPADLMQIVLDHLEQGVLVVELDGTIISERSAAAERLLGPMPASRRVADYVAAFAPEVAPRFAAQWDALRDDALALDLGVAALPSELIVAGRHIAITYKLASARVLVVVRDVTDEREKALVLAHMLRGRASFLAFHRDAAHHVTRIEAGGMGDVGFRCGVHTLARIAAAEGLHSIARLCHDAQVALENHDEQATRSTARAIAERWQFVTSMVDPLLDGISHSLEVVPRDLERVELAVRRRARATEVLGVLASWRYERIEPRLRRIADDARALASRLGKGELAVHIEAAEDLRLPADQLAGFWSAFVHAIYNAVDHGIEPADERRAIGKHVPARLHVRAVSGATGVKVELEDDGRGIDWARIAERAKRRGVPAETPEQLVEALFTDGLTMRDGTGTSGRGVGLAALREACIAVGGRVDVSSQRGRGTTLTFTLPPPAAPAISRSITARY